MKATVGLLAAALTALGCSDPPPDMGPGLSFDLAAWRSKHVSDLEYDLTYRVPDSPAAPITGRATIRFTWRNSGPDLPLDFKGRDRQVDSLIVNRIALTPNLVTDHLVIPGSTLNLGSNEIQIVFKVGDDAFNRQSDLLYTLFVPDRASLAFPSFDQPDLKGRFQITLELPTGWQAITNGNLAEHDSSLARSHRWEFTRTKPISTYLLAFAAGRMTVDSADRDGRLLIIHHRETDTAKVAKNRDAIFDLHALALRWLEAYTGIPYPFDNFAFFAIPAFQFGGMEHPGAVWYRADGLFLDPGATRNQELARASLIAHETAHMWFGDLVTMRWFNDVWMKEVFANFMAAKIVGPAFPDVDWDLRFFQAHHPVAYGVDRTEGSHPIRQDLVNLQSAGSLYGAIIYQKAPIVMRGLERLVGESDFRVAVRRYLDKYRYGNADWSNLIDILDEISEEDLSKWNKAWVETGGRPVIDIEVIGPVVTVTQADPVPERKLHWPQSFTIVIGAGDSSVSKIVDFSNSSSSSFTLGPQDIQFVLPGADGLGYGRIRLPKNLIYPLLQRAGRIPDAVHRAVAWHLLYEEVLAGWLPPGDLLAAAVNALPFESNELILGQLLGQVESLFWRYLNQDSRAQQGPGLEQQLWDALTAAQGASRKSAIFSTIRAVSTTALGNARLLRIWEQQTPPPGLLISNSQYTSLAFDLAIRLPDQAVRILSVEESRIDDPDRLNRFKFIAPAASPDWEVRREFLQGLSAVENRRRESWVLDAQRIMFHPLRASQTIASLRTALELAIPIQLTGDIFFPSRWLTATLDGYQSAAAAQIVIDFLDDNPVLPPGLRNKVLQAADDLFRAATIYETWRSRSLLDQQFHDWRPQ